MDKPNIIGDTCIGHHEFRPQTLKQFIGNDRAKGEIENKIKIIQQYKAVH